MHRLWSAVTWPDCDIAFGGSHKRCISMALNINRMLMKSINPLFTGFYCWPFYTYLLSLKELDGQNLDGSRLWGCDFTTLNLEMKSLLDSGAQVIHESSGYEYVWKGNVCFTSNLGKGPFLYESIHAIWIYFPQLQVANSFVPWIEFSFFGDSCGNFFVFFVYVNFLSRGVSVGYDIPCYAADVVIGCWLWTQAFGFVVDIHSLFNCTACLGIQPIFVAAPRPGMLTNPEDAAVLAGNSAR